MRPVGMLRVVIEPAVALPERQRLVAIVLALSMLVVVLELVVYHLTSITSPAL